MRAWDDAPAPPSLCAQVGSILKTIKNLSWEPVIFFAFSRKVGCALICVQGPAAHRHGWDFGQVVIECAVNWPASAGWG